MKKGDFGNQHAGRQMKGDKWRGRDFGNQHAGRQMKGDKWRRETRSGSDFGNQRAGRQMKGDKWRRETRSGSDFGNQRAGRQMKGDKWRRLLLFALLSHPIVLGSGATTKLCWSECVLWAQQASTVKSENQNGSLQSAALQDQLQGSARSSRQRRMPCHQQQMPLGRQWAPQQEAQAHKGLQEGTDSIRRI